MRKIIKLTESDLTRIVKRVIKENESIVDKEYFLRMSIDVGKTFEKSMVKYNPCKYVKLSTYFKKVFENFIVDIILNNKSFRDKVELEYDNGDDSTEDKIRRFIIDEYGGLVHSYYKIKCNKSPK